MTIQHPTTPGVTFKDVPEFPAYCVGNNGSMWSRWIMLRGRSSPRLGDVWVQRKTHFKNEVYGRVQIRNGTQC